MSNFIFLYALFIINYLLSNQKLCENNEIEHCIECDNEICTKCEDKYFVLFAGLKCISCTDKDYGQPACEGNCDNSKYNEIDNVLCDKCKEGYYSIEGICIPCLDGSEFCEKCSYEASPGSDKKIYTCHECVGGKYGKYRVSNVDGKCRTCSLPPNCLECRYKNGTNDVECIKCKNDYYLSKGICNSCSYQDNPIANGICKNYYCPGGYTNKNSYYCSCNYNYRLTTQNTCMSCPNNCDYAFCYYDNNAGKTKCNKCNINYILTDEGQCILCPNYCESCYYDNISDSAKCKTCRNNDVLTTQNTCISCSSPCQTCYYDKDTDSAKCLSCIVNYVKTPQNTCISCPSNCNSCSYDKNLSLAICHSCKNNYELSLIKECIYCGDGCIHCNLEDGDIKCISCYKSYILENNKCTKLSVPAYCNDYISQRFNNKDEVICTKCDYRYALDKRNNKCINCPINCTYCHFDVSNRLICDNCDLNNVLNETKLCEFCTSNEEIGGEGCLQCKYENGINNCTNCRSDYIHIDNDYVCKLPSDVNLNIGCRNATKLPNGEYSCNKCRNISYTMMTRYNSTNDCYTAENELVYCEKGYEDENKNLSCTNCLYNYRSIWSEKYQISVCDNQCASDYFFNKDLDNRGCYKCDDEKGGGQIGCNPKKGCSYIPADKHLYCNSCKTGYFLYDWQCLPCSKKDSNCIECDYNKTEDKFKCNKCISNIFYINKTSLCDIITYDEYPEITVGCILPINNYTTYIKSGTCFDCKPGFFKNEESLCIYCKARGNGGPKCDECQNIKGKRGRINCKICQNGNMLSPIGNKCYNCEDEVGPGCVECIFEGKDEKVICKECKKNYYRNEEGYCIYKDNGDKFAPNCLIFDNNKSNSKRLLVGQNGKCIKCNDGYYLNENENCEILSLDICSFQFMYYFTISIYDECKKFCEMNNYAFVDYKENNEKIENILKKELNISNDETEIKDIIKNGYLCINNVDENNGLRKCIKIEYDSNTKKFKCLKCINGYELINPNNICVQITDIEKNITEQECNNETIFIKSGNYSFCEKPIGELEGCINGTADTRYVNTKYNCYYCSVNYIPYFSQYYNRNICVGKKFPPLENTKVLSDDAYKKVDKDTDIKDGKCSYSNLFTPDGKTCYYCQNENVGMYGCEGSCTYSLKRINILECEENKCKSGYLETSKGICELCDIVNKGCKECNYTESYPDGYPYFRRQRRFECKECDEGYQLAKDGTCHHCSEFGFTYCDKCIKNEINNEYECIQCIDGYFLANNGYCTKCEAPKVQGTENRCIFCNNTKEGGIRGCELCVSDNGNITCQQCKKGFILSEDDETCLEISDYPNVESFSNCQKISKDEKNIYKCTKCFDNYNFLYDINRNEEKCVNNEFILTPKPETLKYCKNSINMGTENQPKHSCEKCIENDILTQEQREKGITFTKITFKENETSFCDINSKYYEYGMLENCAEARRIKDEEGRPFYNCTKCLNESKFVRKVYLDYDLRVCAYYNYSKYCMVKNCKTCKYGNNYFCSQCLLDNYEVNPATGSCIKKLSKAPAISFKDGYALKFNDSTQCNSQKLDGYSFNLRGISGSQFPAGHAFKINLIFDIFYNRNLRNIEENDTETKDIKVPTYCQIIGHTDEVKYKINLIDYYCFANRTGEDEIRESQIRLKKIEVSNDDNKDNTEFIEFSNFEDMISKLNLDELKDKDTSSFTLKKFNDVTVFEMDEVVDQKSENYTFDFIIYGRINKELEPDIIQTKFELRRIKNIFADCEFNIRENQTADLKCHVNLEEYKEKDIFKFKTIEFQYKESSIYLNRFNEINLVHDEREKKSKTLTIIIVISIILAIILVIIVFFLIRNISKKKKIENGKQTDNVIIYKSHIRSIKNHPINQVTETNSHKRSLKNKKNTE